MNVVSILTALVLLCASSRQLEAQGTLPVAGDTSAAVVAWIRQNAIPLRYIEPGNDGSDLQPLKRILEDVRIVGLGESTHGAREFALVKHRIIEFLVREMGFTALAIEGAYGDADAIDEYIVLGTGERAAAVTQLGYVAHDTEEFSALVDWLQAYNRTVPDANKVRFYGLDLFRNDIARSRILAFLVRIAPEQIPSTDSVFRALAVQEQQWPLWDTTAIAHIRPRLEALSSYVVAKETRSIGIASRSEFDEILQYIRVMQQAVALQGRSAPMAENLMYRVDRAPPGTKFIVWTHDSHVAVNTPDPKVGAAGWTFGYHLRRHFGSHYYGIALEFDRGSYLSRVFPPPGDFKAGVLAPAAEGSVPWQFTQAGIPNLLLDLRATPRSELVERWLQTPRPVHGITWAYQDPARVWAQRSIGSRYDGILFVSEITPLRPTPNGRRLASSGRGFMH